MGLEDQHTNRNDGLARNEGLAPARNRDFRNADDIEAGCHILARMIADYHLRRKGSYKQRSSDEEPDHPPH